MTLASTNSALALSELTDAALRVRTVEAATTYDTETLCLVLLAYMRSGSRQGARTSPRTLTAYGAAARDYVAWAQVSGVELRHPGHRDGGRYLAHLQERPSAGRGRRGLLAPATIAQYIAGARALHRALTWAGASDASPFLTTSAPADRTPAIERRPPYRDELEQLLVACEPRLAALLLLCAHGGLRAGEALMVSTSDIEGGRLVVHGKGGKLRRVPLSRRTREALAGLAPLGTDGHFFDWTYSQAAYRMRQASRAAGLPGHWRGFHAARKHGGTRLYEKVRDFTRVSLFLGHASVDTTRRYVAVDPDDVAAEVEDF